MPRIPPPCPSSVTRDVDYPLSQSESRLYSFSPETKEKLRKFRLGTSRAKDPQAVIYIIDNKSQEIRPEDGEVYTKMEDLADELPETSPRFILLSYPLTLSSGRLTVPYVMLYYLPENCNPSLRMMYAGAVELMRSTAEVNRVIEVESEEDIVEIEAKLQSQN
ncbi:glia maturation factor beta [Aspergillus uvarum CBS 121591]|uniref:Glia maturation factor beta n=1 Tax=Aspergillus uvarum CBS 121591 TaxID=1448315 RepID=A0A319CL38_9EURO|nr:glia maturation factor beta [Aspergillus uvarum CBS 121591]PYH83807.1 glia maturation factor beta [Aspergillus uvarum CBS 121591]